MHDLLSSIRRECCISASVIEQLNNRAIGAPNMPQKVTDLKEPIFIVPRHTLINIINEELLPVKAKRAGKRLVKFYADIKGVDSDGREYSLPDGLLQAARDRSRLGKEAILPCYSVYEGQELCFVHGNINLDLGWTTNSSCTVRTIVFDKREPPDPGTGDCWELQYTPLALVVETDASRAHSNVVEGLPPGCFPVQLSMESGPLDIPPYLQGAGNSTSQIYIRRRGFHLIPIEATTSYFVQGNTFPLPKQVVVDLRIPRYGSINPAVPYVCFSRPKSLTQLYLLHPLWTNEKEKEQYLKKAARVYKYDPDTVAVMQHMADLTAKTKEAYPDSRLHYTTAEKPHICATCRADLRFTK